MEETNYAKGCPLKRSRKNPPLLIRLTQDCGLLPAGVTLQLPFRVSCSLIMRDLCTPVADFKATPDLVLSEEDLLHAGLENDPAWHTWQAAA